MRQTPDILSKILQRKAQEIRTRAEHVSLRELSKQVDKAPAVTSFLGALDTRIRSGQAAVIAELKKASPSRGVLREAFEPEHIARSYAQAGATCLSVLTDRDFFQGDEAYLPAARTASGLPVLRKDFIIDAYQVYESRVIGADCVLLIVAALGDASLVELLALTQDLEMDALLEVHNAPELERALALEAPLIGINNRDLRTFKTQLDTTLRLKEHVPDDRIVVTESGIHTRKDVSLMRKHGIHAFLVGEAFMRAVDPGAKLKELFE
jgi:indole-3-glycerol phosphate synthase